MKIMTKTMGRISLLILLTYSFTSFLNAANVTWLGGSGDWDDPAKWDSGQVPTANDHVYIPSGTVRLYSSADAISTDVSAGARLVIYPDGTLELDGAVNRPALNNAGRVYIIGALLISNVTSPNGYNGKGIYNTDGLYVYQGALLRIQGIDDYAIDNRAPGFVSSNGTTIIEGLYSHGIYNTGTFRNYRDISIYPNTTNLSYGVHNRGTFLNYQDGDIYIQYGYVGFLNNTGASLDNYGEISSYDAQNTGIKNYSAIHNHTNGILRSRDAQFYGITNGSQGVIDNDQLIECFYSNNTGMRNNGTINNNRSIVILGYHVIGFYLPTGSTFNNYSSLSVTPNSSITALHGTWIRGELINHEDGIFSTSDKIFVSGQLQNYGYMNLGYDGNHSMSSGAEFNNYSVIDDNFGTLPSGVNNEKLIVKPVSGVMEVGQAFADVLDVESLDDITLVNWKVGITNSTSAGVYDPNTNTFTPNANAVGLTTIYISINNGGSITRNHTLELENPIQNFKGKDSPQFNLGRLNESINRDQELSIFPNPSAGDITIEAAFFEKEKTSIQIWNNLGQIIWKTVIPQGSKVQNIHLRDELVNGLYLVQFFQGNEHIGTEKIFIQK